MTQEEWLSHLKNVAIWYVKGGQVEDLRLLSLALEEADQAKLLLREAGYGCTGRGLLNTVRDALQDIKK